MNAPACQQSDGHQTYCVGSYRAGIYCKGYGWPCCRFEKLSGKYTLVDFWASWCGPCRQESPTLVRLYTKYKGKGFAIVSVSIDTDKTRWENAIKKDGYTWENVSELDGYSGSTAALYTVTAIPNSFLLDKDGKIIAKNLRGKNLEDKLISLMGQ
ncbi:redoxin domain-containing protein [Spirosoma sp. HMF3257]|uniref:Thioredoxin domain-containing protein n=1 Tax=Spirosoma telluris TaxID=2183553 RepID=A0A327NRL0_9BACT|nr:redoxin domain-containing protein [Spirosoma telluris]RAI78031.1 hypothetical protein HMF3257_35155 [Spirosoma telluris]